MAGEALAEQRRALISRAFEALNGRDRDALIELIPDDAEFRSAIGAVEGSGVYRGPHEFLELFDLLLSTWDEMTWHLDRVHDAGEKTAILYRTTGVAKGSGVPLEQPLGQVWTWRQGEAAPSLVEIFTDPREALEATGLSDRL